jgi:cytochrome c peroxidase
MKTRITLVFSVLFAVLLAVGWFAKGRPEVSSSVVPPAHAHATPLHGREALLPLPSVPDLAAEKVALGKRLFFEKRLSNDNSLACAGCHDFARGGGDNLPAAIGVGGKQGTVNAPTVFNAGLNFVQFWDGRAASLEEQAAGPVHNPLEMASSWEEAIPKLQQDEGYLDAFQRLYPQGMTGATIVDAIATYERTLITPNSRFDRFLHGDKSALSKQERAGYQHFLDYGCASCHQGALLGGNMYQRFGVMGDFFKERPAAKAIQADLGRFNVTGREEDRHVFKVPSLRNVAVTAPYFHDGSAATLEEAVIIMGRYQLGRDLSGSDVVAIVAFLRTLTGEWEGKPLQ